MTVKPIPNYVPPSSKVIMFWECLTESAQEFGNGTVDYFTDRRKREAGDISRWVNEGLGLKNQVGRFATSLLGNVTFLVQAPFDDAGTAIGEGFAGMYIATNDVVFWESVGTAIMGVIGGVSLAVGGVAGVRAPMPKMKFSTYIMGGDTMAMAMTSAALPGAEAASIAGVAVAGVPFGGVFTVKMDAPDRAAGTTREPTQYETGIRSSIAKLRERGGEWTQIADRVEGLVEKLEAREGVTSRSRDAHHSLESILDSELDRTHPHKRKKNRPNLNQGQVNELLDMWERHLDDGTGFGDIAPKKHLMRNSPGAGLDSRYFSTEGLPLAAKKLANRIKYTFDEAHDRLVRREMNEEVRMANFTKLREIEKLLLEDATINLAGKPKWRQQAYFDNVLLPRLQALLDEAGLGSNSVRLKAGGQPQGYGSTRRKGGS